MTAFELLGDHLVKPHDTIKSVLEKLNEIGSELTVFVTNDDGRLLGSVTDGDIRRALIRGLMVDSTIDRIMNKDFVSLTRDNYSLEDVIKIRQRKIKLVPLLTQTGRLEKLINFEVQKNVLPLDAVIMAGGEGTRLRPLTEEMPKPLLKIGQKPIIEYTLDRLTYFGIENCFITVKYLGEKIKEYYGDGTFNSIRIQYVDEQNAPLGTIGSVSLIEGFAHPSVLVTNSDLLTNIDLEDFYSEFESKKADMIVATVPYKVNVPYAVLETSDEKIISLKEKPTYTYYSNAGMYIIRKELLDRIPKGGFFNATDLMELAITNKKRVITYPLHCYWLDIGKHEDFIKAQEDVKHISFK